MKHLRSKDILRMISPLSDVVRALSSLWGELWECAHWYDSSCSPLLRHQSSRFSAQKPCWLFCCLEESHVPKRFVSVIFPGSERDIQMALGTCRWARGEEKWWVFHLQIRAVLGREHISEQPNLVCEDLEQEGAAVSPLSCFLYTPPLLCTAAASTVQVKWLHFVWVCVHMWIVLKYFIIVWEYPTCEQCVGILYTPSLFSNLLKRPHNVPSQLYVL